jgi:hypothetical protein
MERNPGVQQGPGRRTRRPAKDDLDMGGPGGHGIAALGEMLRAMNPYALGNPQGSCESCAWETVRALLHGRKPRPIISIDPANAQELKDWPEQERKRVAELKQAENEGELLKAPDGPRAHSYGEYRVRDLGNDAPSVSNLLRTFAPGPARAQTVFAWLSEASHGEAVFVARGGGHVWN